MTNCAKVLRATDLDRGTGRQPSHVTEWHRASGIDPKTVSALLKGQTQKRRDADPRPSPAPYQGRVYRLFRDCALKLGKTRLLRDMVVAYHLDVAAEILELDGPDAPDRFREFAAAHAVLAREYRRRAKALEE
jgi:hypothetical protein